MVSSHFSVPYLDWGMKDPSVLFLRVDQHVNIDIATAGVIVERDAAHSARWFADRQVAGVGLQSNEW